MKVGSSPCTPWTPAHETGSVSPDVTVGREALFSLLKSYHCIQEERAGGWPGPE